ncbi:MAG TPA: hypothetical protein VJO33_00935 [Gemmatimonadaceae bacterium]|nr:hypothetical protein [Gemmatimonadaceae bacterium]
MPQQQSIETGIPEHARLERATLGFLIAIGLGLSAIYWRRTPAGRRFAVLSSLSAIVAFLTEHRIFGEFGHISANTLAYCCGIATIVSAYRSSSPRREQDVARSRNNDLVWIGTTLYSIAYKLLLRIFDQKSTGLSGPALTAMLVLIAVILYLTTSRRPRLSAAMASGLGTAGVTFLALLSFFPLTYIGLIGVALLRSWLGWLFYAASIGGIWAYLRQARQLRAEVSAPTGERWLGIPVAIAIGVAIVSTASLLR